MESVPEPPAIFDELTLGGNVGGNRVRRDDPNQCSGRVGRNGCLSRKKPDDPKRPEIRAALS